MLHNLLNIQTNQQLMLSIKQKKIKTNSKNWEQYRTENNTELRTIQNWEQYRTEKNTELRTIQNWKQYRIFQQIQSNQCKQPK